MDSMKCKARTENKNGDQIYQDCQDSCFGVGGNHDVQSKVHIKTAVLEKFHSPGAI